MSAQDSQTGGSQGRVRHVISALKSDSCRYRLIQAQSPEANAVADWIQSQFPIIGMQIDWAKVASSRCLEWAETTDLVKGLATLIQDLPPGTPVIVTWSDALYPSLEMTLSEAAKVAPEIFETTFDTWIVCQSENWCVEVHHEGTICFGYGRPTFVFLGVKPSQT